MNLHQPQKISHSGPFSWWQSQLRRVPPLYAFGKNIRYLLFAVQSGLFPALWRGYGNGTSRGLAYQREWNVALPHFAMATELADWLSEQGVSFIDAEHTLYIPPQQILENLFPEISRFYPSGSGFKILKDLRSPESANYLAGRAGSVAVRRRLTGSPAEQLITANYMHTLGIGPRVWDICRWSSEGNELTVFVVDHIEGTVPTHDECRKFIDRLRQLVSESYLRILIMNWETQDDFECPGCRNNLFHAQNNTSLQYVDFQNFRLNDPANWMRDTAANAVESTAELVHSLSESSLKLFAELKRVGVNIEDRVVMHVQCGLGETLGMSITQGAAWVYGWTSTESRQNTESFLFSQGFGRFTVFESDASNCGHLYEDASPAVRERLSESILFYQFDEESGDEFCRAVQTLPWRILVCHCETGHFSSEIIPQHLRDAQIDAQCLSTLNLTSPSEESHSIDIFSRE